MPDYSAALPQLQNTDILGAYLRGREMPVQQQMQQQEMQHGQMSLEQLQLAMQTTKLRNQAAQQFLGDQGQAGTGSNQPSASMPSDLPPGSPAPQPGQSPLDALADPARLANMAKYGQFNAMMSGGDPIKPVIDAQNAHEANVKDQQQRTKFALQPKVDEIETVRTAPNPEQLVMANPSYLKLWQQYAPMLGLHPNDPKDMTPDNVRKAAAMAHNALAGQSMGTIEPVAMPSSLQTVTEGGYSYDVDPLTGKKSDIPGQTTPYQSAQLGMEKQRLSLQQRISEGFNGQAGELLAAMTEKGVTLPAGMRSKEQQLATVKGLLDRHPDMSPDEIAEAVKTGKIDMAVATKGATQFATGKQGDTVRSLSVATAHLDTLGTMVDALNNGDVKLLNKAGNAWQQQTGGAAPTNFDTVKNIVADEVTKAVIGYGGSSADREKAAAVIDRANSPAQLKGAIQTYKTLMSGQLQGLQRQYEHSTQRKDFDTMLSPAAQKEIGGGGVSKTINGKTYVQRNGKWYEG